MRSRMLAAALVSLTAWASRAAEATGASGPGASCAPATPLYKVCPFRNGAYGVKGRHAFSGNEGDATSNESPLDDNIDDDRPTRGPDPRACVEAMARIRSRVDIVLPAQDPEVLVRWPKGVVGGKE